MNHTFDKQAWRRKLRQCRLAVAQPDVAAAKLLGRLVRLPEWERARQVLLYLGVRSEVPTLPFVEQELLNGQREISLPWCDGDALRSAWITGRDELVEGAFGILEPRPDVRRVRERERMASDFDLFVIPGVGFDRCGNRLGSGKGYYDRFLVDARPDALIIGIGFDCQLVDELPLEPHDRRMDLVITDQELLDLR
ncbi:MAG: 5-formyltetrahydrofolate cyclo-ligase [Planctomycetaceae bacterium]|nr:5-formyltetrahydrofolate cyclo-ligase [Planctomycetaceae bacterium]